MPRSTDDAGPHEVWVITGYDEWGEPIYGYVPADTADHWRADVWHPKP